MLRLTLLRDRPIASKESGMMIRSMAAFICIAAVALTGIAYTFGYVVPPGMMGVRKIGAGPGKGFHKVALDPGYHPGLPFFGYSVVYLVPETVQVLHLHRDRSRYPEGFDALMVQTTDGVKVSVDISLFVRFYSAPGKMDKLEHGGPADLLQMTGLNSSDWMNRIWRDAQDELRRSLGELSTQDFYNPMAREKKLLIALAEMNRRLARFGIKVEDVLLRRYTYEEDVINDAIFSKNLQVQEEKLNSTLEKFADVTARLEETKAQLDAKIKTLQVAGQSKVQVLESEGQLYEKRKIAAGDKAVALAKAEVDRLTRDVLADSRGAEIYVARELAPILGSLKGGVVSGIDPFDLDRWVDRLGVTDE